MFPLPTASRLKSALLAVVVALSSPALKAEEEAPIYQSHFEDNIQQLVDWKANDAPENAEISVRRLSPEETTAQHPAALLIRSEAASVPLRISQASQLFALTPERNYELRVTLRVPELRIQQGGRVRVFITDARWQWSGPSLAIPEASDWQTLSLPFTAPAEVAPHYRIRIEALRAMLEMEIANIAIIPLP